MKKTLGSIGLLLIFIGIFACEKKYAPKPEEIVDVALIGGGIMSANVGIMLRELEPDFKIIAFEKLGAVAQESSAPWNNAGTGHSAFCELNYTPQAADGSIDINKAVSINESFEVSKQLWSHLVQTEKLPSPRSFVNNVPHMSFVWGDDNVSFLKKRFEIMSKHPLFSTMVYSEDKNEISRWVPLVMEGRDPQQKIAATKVDGGVDVNFGALTKGIFDSLARSDNTELYLKHKVVDLSQNDQGIWTLVVKDIEKNVKKLFHARFVFIGAGGASLTLLQKSKIPEAKAYAGFPVGGEWLVSENKDLVDRHMAKVYGKASVGSPPMSVPHLDTRFIDGKRALLFGPFAVFSTKFLKQGSWLDILASFRINNWLPMLKAGFDNIDLTKYLIGQVMLSKDERVESLRQYFPKAKSEDFRHERAGQRVQIIKNHPEKGGILQFGTEIVGSKDGSIVALLGASPGASVAAQIALDVLEKSFAEQMKNKLWQMKIKQMIPSYGRKLTDSKKLRDYVARRNQKILGLKF